MRSIKTVLHTALFLLFVLTFASCIKNEALNQEADIVAAKVSNNELLIRKPLITNNEVKFFVHNWRHSSNLLREQPLNRQAEPFATS